MTWTLASDIDGTLTGDRSALDALRRRLHRAREAGELRLILCTGRQYEDVLEGIDAEGLPVPDAIVAQVGTEIYVPPFAGDAPPLEAWRTHIERDFSRDDAERFLDGIEGFELQRDRYNTRLKVSATLEENREDGDLAAERVADRVRGAGPYQVVWSMSRFLDIIPARAGKGRAVVFAAEHLGADAERIVGAGDTGNDASLLGELACGIIVGNATTELIAASKHAPGRVYRARRPYAAGVAEGLEHFGALPPGPRGGAP